MALPNSEKITSQLASMPDQALKQMAMMHKADPYILPLIISEDGRRKRTRQAAQSQMAQMPKVADAAVDQMGIAQLSAPNIQGMADGGIAGYDDASLVANNEPVLRMAGGGDVKKYSGKTESLVRTTNGGKTWFLDIPKTIRDPSVPYYREIPNPAAELADMEFPSREAAIQAATTASTKYQSSPGGKPYSLGLGSALPTVDNIYTTPEGKRFIRDTTGTQAGFNEDRKQASRQVQAGTFQRPDDPIVPRWSESAAVAPSVAASAAPSDAPTAPPAAASPAAAASTAPKVQGQQGETSGQGIQSIYDLFAGPKNKRDTELNEIQQRIREQGEAETSAAQRQLNQLKTDLAAQGEYGKDRETKLKAKEERIGKEEGQAGGLALLEAGLAMMSGTSANAFENIGKGALAGTAAYRKSVEKIADARDKLEDAYGRLEDVRFNQKNLNNSEIRKATADVDKAANAGLKSLTDFAVTRYGMSREDAKTMFTGAMQERVANIGAGATRYAADRRSADNKDYINAVKGSGAIEQARRNVMEQVMKANKYGTPEELQTQFEKEWEKTLQLNPALAKLAGTAGGGSAVDTTGFKVLR